jgi:hypothetical protein
MSIITFSRGWYWWTSRRTSAWSRRGKPRGSCLALGKKESTIMPFQNARAQIQQIPINTQIPNWTVDNGYFGDPVTIIDGGNDHVTFDAQGAQKAQHVPQPDFAGVYDVWDDYI